ncbi:unnamed protein product (macronuclear) [Paramecium tetraurelia]|uniref:Uncharacterized protein n=1 Tax=Paramecium tetraurelia TaxID=5888 RepID=A0CH25_PARTE|nr:uncharacterized protein GSPATT00007532001 [Paramecium tetraurelia]CAK70092.1 unnamed protein product [Paramecium tetraurelia]|eukprot:XP_001437489.1 hypothetical protein (macronuclear) [Paramecium tetraurelia strain d4-2]
MKTFVVICLVAAVFALDTNKFAVLLQTGTRGNDAVESVYNLLRDLKTENVNVQAAADKKNNTDEEIFSQVIGDLTNVAALNKQQWERLGAVRTDVEAQVRDGYQWLAWAEARLAEIVRRNNQLQDQRCWANGLFVKSLADHADAIGVVTLLTQDVAGFLTNNAGVELVEKASTIADKLSAYSHLFQQDALQKFQSLAEVKRDGTTGEQVLQILQDLQVELESTLATLIRIRNPCLAFASCQIRFRYQCRSCLVDFRIRKKNRSLLRNQKLNSQPFLPNKPRPLNSGKIP